MKTFLSLAAVGAVAAAFLVGCGGSSGIINQPLPRVRTVNGFTGVTTVNSAVNTDVISTNGQYGVATDYAILGSTGTKDIIFTDPTNPTPPLATSNKTFTFRDKVTAIGLGGTGSRSVIVLNDNTTLAPNGQFALRVVHAAPAAGNVDVYLTTPGASLAGATPITVDLGQVFPTQPTGSSDYQLVTIPADPTTYELRIFPRGATTGALFDQNISVAERQRLTVAVLDPNGSAAPTVVTLRDDQ